MAAPQSLQSSPKQQTPSRPSKRYGRILTSIFTHLTRARTHTRDSIATRVRCALSAVFTFIASSFHKHGQNEHVTKQNACDFSSLEFNLVQRWVQFCAEDFWRLRLCTSSNLGNDVCHVSPGIYCIVHEQHLQNEPVTKQNACDFTSLEFNLNSWCSGGCSQSHGTTKMLI